MATARFPTAIATAADLKLAANLVQSSLAAPITATDLVLTVRDGSRFQPYMLLSIEKEIVSASAVSGNQITVQRGFDGTTAAPHAASALVSVFIDAWHHNMPAAEIMAIEAFLGPNGQNLSTATTSALYNFPAQAPGGALSPGLNVITLTPVPPGVNGTDPNHYLYISGGTGAAEAVLIGGGTAVAGAASGTVIVSCANAHSGAWTIRSASSGIQEAISAVRAAGGGAVSVPAGQWDVYALTTIPWKVSVAGVDRHAVIIRNQSATSGVFRLDAPFDSDLTKAMGLYRLTIVSSAVGRTTVDVAAPAVHLYGTGNMTMVSELTISNHDIGVHFAGSVYTILENFEIAIYGSAGVFVEYGDGNFIRAGLISNTQSTSTPVAAAAGISCKHFGGLYVNGVDIIKGSFGVKFQPASGNACNYGFFSDVLTDTTSNHGWYFDATAGGEINTIQCIDCWASFCGFTGSAWANPSRGIMINGLLNNPCGVSFIGGRARMNGGNGVQIDGGAQIKIIGMEINANSQQTLNGFSGISTAGPAQHLILANNQIGNFMVGPANQMQGFGILLGGGATSDFVSVQGNDVTGNNTASLGVLAPFAAAATVSITGNLGVDGVWSTLASAATLTLNPALNCYKLTGAVPVATIAGGWSGRRIVLVFTDAAPGGLAAGGNIGKAITATQNQRFTCEFDGATWWCQ